MTQTLKRAWTSINEALFHCPYWETCPCYDKKVCCDAWIMGGCGKYRKYQKEDEAKEKTL